MVPLSDQEIINLIAESKPLPENYRSLMRLRDKRGHKERELDVKSLAGHDFRIIERQSLLNILDFSVILAYCPKETNVLFLLRRYNGKSHEHTNVIEGQTFYNYHIHQATERYQIIGAKEASYAEPTTEYASIEEALECLFKECGFTIPLDPNPQQISFL